MVSFHIRLNFQELRRPYLLDVSSLLYDLELLHDFAILTFSEDYIDYNFNRFFWYRNRRPIKKEHKIKAVRIIKESPLMLELVFAGVVAISGSFWVFIQAIEKINNRKLNRRKLELEVENMEIDRNIKFKNEQIIQEEYERKMLEKNAWHILNNILERLEENPHTLIDINLLYYENDDSEE